MPFIASSRHSPTWPPASEFHCGSTSTAARRRVRDFAARGKQPAVDRVVLGVRRVERAGKRQQPLAVVAAARSV